MIANPVDSLLTTQTLATLAYIARERGDTLLSDSLYTQILQTPPSDAWRSRARKALGLDDLTPTPTGQTAQLIDSAEALWQVNNDIDAARLLYILASEVADSSDTLAARALLAAARITRVGLGQDSLAGLLYAEVTKRFPGSAHAKAAQKYAPRSAGRAEPRQRQAEMEKLPEEVDDGSDPFAQVMAPAENEEVFAPDKVDEPPQLLTLPEIVDSYLRSYYPFEAYSERLRGRVELNITVRTSGEVTDVEVSKVEPEGYGFDEAARQVLSSCNFRPGRMKGKPVSVRFKQVFTFKPPEER
jgi:TonB family protein